MFFRDIFGVSEAEFARKINDGHGALEFPSDFSPSSKPIRMIYGRRAATNVDGIPKKPFRFSVVTDDVAVLQADPSNAGATFQIASNFHGLEQMDSESSPESTLLEDYVYDRTQGPIAVLETPADLIYRRYGLGYSDEKLLSGGWPLDMLSRVRKSHNVGITVGGWASINQGTIPLELMSDKVTAASNVGSVLVEGALVSHDGNGRVLQHKHRINHVLTSTYDAFYDAPGKDNDLGWMDAFLMAAYINTLEAAVAAGSYRIFLTMIGGGVFANPQYNIKRAMGTAFNTVPLPEGSEVLLVLRNAGSVDASGLSNLASGHSNYGEFLKSL